MAGSKAASINCFSEIGNQVKKNSKKKLSQGSSTEYPLNLSLSFELGKQRNFCLGFEQQNMRRKVIMF